MGEKTTLYQTEIGNSNVGEHYLKQIFKHLNAEQTKDFTHLFEKYSTHYDELLEAMLPEKELNLQQIIHTFPLLNWMIIHDLGRVEGYYRIAKYLYLSNILFHVNAHHLPHNFGKLFLQSIHGSDSLERDFKEGGTDLSKDASSTHRLFHRDYQFLVKNYFRFQLTKNRGELIENLFCFIGQTQIYLRYYFDFLLKVETEEAIRYIESLFLEVFTFCKAHENSFWELYGNPKQIRDQVLNVVLMDSPNNRHSVLRLHIFLSIEKFNPILYNENEYGGKPIVSGLLREQIKAFNKMSFLQVQPFLSGVLAARGEAHVAILLNYLKGDNRDRFFDFCDWLEEEGKKDKKLVSLVKIITIFSKKFPRKVVSNEKKDFRKYITIYNQNGSSEKKDTTEQIVDYSKQKIGSGVIEKVVYKKDDQNSNESLTESQVKESQAENQEPVDTEILKEEKIMMGFEEGDQKVSAIAFFELPFGPRRKGPVEEDWFEYHKKYLDLLAEKKLIETSYIEQISSLLNHLPKRRYRKYFDIFPNNRFDDTAFMATFTLWKNQDLSRLLVK